VVKTILFFLIGSLLLATLYYSIFTLFFNSSKEERLERENSILKNEYMQSAQKMELLESVIQNIERKDREVYYKIFKSTPPNFLNEHINNFYSLLDTASNLSLIEYSSDKIRYSRFRSKKIGARINELGEELRESRKLDALPIAIPLRHFNTAQTGAGMGLKIHPFYKSKIEHMGIDLMAPLGTDVIATADGVVKEALRSNRGRGSRITIDHGNGYKTFYAHLGDILVKQGERVRRGAVIARVGNSGLSFAPHLHYEVHFKGKEVDPLFFFFSETDPNMMMEMMFISLNSGQSMD